MKRKKDDGLKVGNTKEDGDSMNSIGKRTGQSLSSPCAGRDVSRRCFAKGVSRIIGLGVLSHFGLLAKNTLAEEPNFTGDACPGGGNADDECSDTDYCPGGQDEQDNCPAPGNNASDECPGESDLTDLCSDPGLQSNDVCNTGNWENDTCKPDVYNVDQCESGLSPDDVCPPNGNSSLDYCPGGAYPEDECAADGGLAEDECPGGDISVDTCKPNGEGDACPPGTSSAGDDCKTGYPDACFFDWQTGVTDDVCTSGVNTILGNGPDDTCGPALGIGPVGDDVCIDGSSEEDKCAVFSTVFNGTTQEVDVCHGGGTDVDVCAPNDPSVLSDDYCGGGESDECKPEVGDSDECPGGGNEEDSCLPPSDPDECPGGGSDADKCLTGAAPEDECTAAGGCAGGDQETSAPIQDACDNQTIDACTLNPPDNPE